VGFGILVILMVSDWMWMILWIPTLTSMVFVISDCVLCDLHDFGLGSLGFLLFRIRCFMIPLISHLFFLFLQISVWSLIVLRISDLMLRLL